MPAAVDALEAFVHYVNPTDRTLHPLDLGRWLTFIEESHREKIDPEDQMVKEALERCCNDDEWIGLRLAEYRTCRELLKRIL